MTLFEVATKLQVRLVAAKEADEGDELLRRGRHVRDEFASAAQYFEDVQSYKSTIGRTDTPPLDAKAIRQAMGHFRTALSRSGPKAVQLPSADKLLRVLTQESRRVDGWVKSTWRQNFSDAQALASRALSGDSHGPPVDMIKAQRCASTIKLALNTDPVKKRAVLEERLKVEGLTACLTRVTELTEELRSAIAAIEKHQAALTAEVRAVLQRAASPSGLPLGEVTPKLLAELEVAGVLDALVVRRS